MRWSAEVDDLLISRWNAGDTMEEVAEALRAAGHAVPSRNAISGRISRMRKRGLLINQGQRDPARPKPSRKPIIRHTRKPMPLQKVRLMPTVLPTPEKPKPTVVTHSNGVEYLDNTEAGCKAVLNKRGYYDLPMVCGKLRCDVDGSRTPYCDDHYSKYHNPQTPRSFHGKIRETV